MSESDATLPGFPSALRFWIKLGFLSFGGPAAQIAMMHRELVDERRWIDHRRFMDALNFCTLLPGPEAMQLATYLGWRMHGVKGGIAAGAMFVLPSAVILFALSWLVMSGGETDWMNSLLLGLMAAVIAIVIQAVWRMGRRTLTTSSLWGISIAAFLAIFAFEFSFVWILFCAAWIGAIGNRWQPSQFPERGGHHSAGEASFRSGIDLPPPAIASWPRTIRITATCLLLWALPIVGAVCWLGWDSTPAQQALFFSKAAMVTFGGAYAVLPYVAQQAVEAHGWLSHPQMMTGLALAETTPGPLIMVLQFVGFVGGWQHPGALPALSAASVCAIITTWVTFLPCFWFIFLGGPHVETLGALPRISAALTALSAAVVGLIFNLFVRFVQQAVWPEPDLIRWPVALLALAAFVVLARIRIGIIPVITLCAAAGISGALG